MIYATVPQWLGSDIHCKESYGTVAIWSHAYCCWALTLLVGG